MVFLERSRFGIKPVIGADGRIYLGFDAAGYFHAIDQSGALIWSYGPFGKDTQASASIGLDGTLYIGNYNKSLYAIHPDGSAYWSYPAPSYILGGMAIASDGTIYAETLDGTLSALRPGRIAQMVGKVPWSAQRMPRSRQQRDHLRRHFRR